MRKDKNSGRYETAADLVADVLFLIAIFIFAVVVGCDIISDIIKGIAQ